MSEVRSWLVRQIHGTLFQYGVLGLIVTLLLPVYTVMKRLDQDVAYHLLRPSLEVLPPGATPRPNAFVELRGRVRPESLYVERSLVKRPEWALFQLEGYPERVVVHVYEGAALDAVARYEEAAGGGAGEGKAAGKGSGAAAPEIVVSGRVHESGGAMGGYFPSFYDEDEVDWPDYLRGQLGLAISGDPPVLREGPAAAPCWLVAAGEAPGALGRTNLAVALFAMGLGVMGAGMLVRRTREKRRAGL